MVKTYSNRYFQIQIPFEWECHPRSSRRALIIICLTVLIGAIAMLGSNQNLWLSFNIKKQTTERLCEVGVTAHKKQCRLDGKNSCTFILKLSVLFNLSLLICIGEFMYIEYMFWIKILKINCKLLLVTLPQLPSYPKT